MVPKEWVRAAYRLLLGREPESEDVVDGTARAVGSWPELRQLFTGCPEFQDQLVQLATPHVNRLHFAPPVQVDVTADPDSLEKILRRIQNSWERMGSEEPYWSVLTQDTYKLSDFDAHSEEFWASGASDTERFLKWLARSSVAPESLTNVLEYGCGTGRVTESLARRFRRVLACDVSRAHLRIASERLAKRKLDNVELLQITLDRLRSLPPVDAVFSIIVLQHNPPPLIAHILGVLLSALTPGGVAYFQVPTYGLGYRFSIREYLAAKEEPRMEMHVLPQNAVFAIVEQRNCRVLEVQPDSSVGSASFLSCTFLVQKR